MLLQLPPSYDHVTQDPITGETKVVRFQCGPILEPDPKTPGFARLARLERGSPVRWGLSYVAASFPANPITILAGAATGDLVVPFREPGYLGKLGIDGLPATATVYLTDVSRNNDRFSSGNTPARYFDPLSRMNPVLGHYVDTTTNVTFNMANLGLGPVVIGVGFSLL